MLIFKNEEEFIEELARNIRVDYKPYGTWRISSYIGLKHNQEGYLYDYFDSHNEEDSIGIFDGEEYNQQDYNEWLYGEFEPELDENDCIANYHDEELKEKFEEYCKDVWSDSANDDNYEPVEVRHKRLAEQLFDIFKEDENIRYCLGGEFVYITEEEWEMINLGVMLPPPYETHYNYILHSKFDEFKKDFKLYQEDKEEFAEAMNKKFEDFCVEIGDKHFKYIYSELKKKFGDELKYSFEEFKEKVNEVYGEDCEKIMKVNMKERAKIKRMIESIYEENKNTK